MTPLIVIPAAGTSSRMRGRDKLLEPVDGIPLLRLQTKKALVTGLKVLVLIRPEDTRRQAVLPNDAALLISSVPGAEEGIAATLRHAVSVAGKRPLTILLPDVPGVTTNDIQTVLTRFNQLQGKAIVRASDPEGRPGTPICLPWRFANRFIDLTGDEGGRSLFSDKDVELIRFDNDRATRDLNTPEDWSDWRARQEGV